MAQILEVKNGTTSLNPGTTWAAPNGLFGATADRNDDTAYGWADSTSTITLPATGLADGYLFLWGYEHEDTSNGRHNPLGRMTQASGTGNFASASTGGFARDSSEDRAYVSGWSFVDNPSASATFQFEWKRDTDAPTGGTVRAFVQVVPLYYADIGIYTSTTAGVYGGTTPNLMTGFSAVIEGTNVTIASNVVSVTGDDKRYLVLGGAYQEDVSGGTRTQRWYGLEIDGAFDHSAKGCMYYRNAANDMGGESFIKLIETATATRTIEMNAYRGIGVSAGEGGADLDGTGTPSNAAHALVVIELNDSAEVFASIDSVGAQEFAVAGPVDVDIASTADVEFSDAASFVRATDIAVNVEVTTDVFAFANVSHAREASSIGSGSRWTVHGEFTVNGVEVTDVGFHGNYNRGNQSTQDTHGSSCNQAGVFAITADQDIGVSNQELSGTEGGAGDIETQANWVGFGIINLDTLAAAPSGAITGATSIAFSEVADLNGTGELTAATPIAFSHSATITALYTKAVWGGTNISPLILPITTYIPHTGGAMSAATSIAFGHTATLSATGELTASAVIAFSEAATLSATGALAGATSIAFSEVGALSGRGALTAAESIDFSQAATLTASGALAGTASIAFTASGALSGTGEIAAATSIAWSSGGTLTGKGPLAAATAIAFSAAGTLNGRGALSAAESIAFSAVGDLNAVGALAASASITFSDAAAISATANITGAATIAFTAAGVLAADGAITGSASIAFSEAGTLTGTGALTAATDITFGQSAVIAGMAPIAGSTSIAFTEAGALSGRGALAAAEAIAFSQAGTLAGTGALTGATSIAFSESADLSGGGLVGATSIAFTASGQLSATVPITGATAVAFDASATIRGRAAMTAAESISWSQTANIRATGTLTASTSLAFSESGTISATGTLTGATAVAFSESAVISATANITGAVTIAFSAIGYMDVGLRGGADIAFSESATLSGRGALTGAASIGFSAAGLIGAIGPLTGATAIAWSAVSSLSAKRLATGSTSIAFSHSATLTGTGTLTGAVSVDFTATATASATALIAGSAVLTFATAGVIFDAGAAVPLHRRLRVNMDARNVVTADDGRRVRGASGRRGVDAGTHRRRI